MRTKTILIALLLAAFALPLAAARDGALMRGGGPDKAFDGQDVESVDKFTGNYSARIPIGPAFTTNGAITYSFGLTYQSRAWDYMGLQHAGSVDTLLTWEMVNVVGFYDFRPQDADPTTLSGMEAVPAYGTNAGLGWTLNVGGFPKFNGFDVVAHRGFPRISYITPDGAEHEFYAQQFGPAGGIPDWRQSGGIGTKYYTRDGSFLRMRKLQEPDPNGVDTSREIDFPDGTIHKIECIAKCDTIWAEWYLTEIRDRFDSKLTFSHTARPVPPLGPEQTVPWIWTITESNQNSSPTRTHEVEFEVRRRVGNRTGFPADWYWDLETRVKQVRLAIAENTTAEYDFTYKNPYINGEIKSNWGDAHWRLLPFVVISGYGFFDISLLDKVTLPKVAGSTDSAGVWRFRYWGGGEPELQLPPNEMLDGPHFTGVPFTFQVHRKSGLLAELIYPTGRGSRVEYRGRAYPRAPCGARPREFFETFTGVREREQTRPIITGNAETGRAIVPGTKWLYRGNTYFGATVTVPPDNDESGGVVDPVQCGQRSVELTSVVVDPAGKAEVTFFSVYTGGWTAASNVWQPSEYGLPISHYDANGSMPVSSEIYDCRAANLQAQADTLDLGHKIRRIVARNRFAHETGPEHVTCGEPLRTTYVEYEYGDACDVTLEFCIHENRRVKRTKTIFADVCNAAGCVRGNDPRFTLTENSNFDGLGHYRQTVVSGNFGDAAEPGRVDSRTIITNYNPGVVYDHAARTINYGPSTWIELRWLLDTYDQAVVQEGAQTQVARYQFDNFNGRLVEQRKLADLQAPIAPQPKDLRVAFARTVEGDGTVNVKASYSGGDHHSADDVLEYVIETRSWLGGIRSVTYLNCNGSAPLQTVYTANLDPVSGLPRDATDGRGLTVTYSFDKLRRLKTRASELEAPVEISYPSLTNRSVLDTGMKQTSTDSVGEARSALSAFDDFEEFDSDGNGPGGTEWVRLTKHTVHYKNADGVSSVRLDALGRVRARTETADIIARGGVYLYKYDIFGRIVEVDPPFPGSITTTYTGPWSEKTITTHVARNAGSTSEAAHYRDTFGRLVAVRDQSDSSDSNLAVTYNDYDAGNRLRQVRMGSQTRTFDYDGRGLLMREKFPELEPKERHYTYDARGNVRHNLLRATADSTSDAGDNFRFVAGGQFDQRYRYDGAEHLRAVEIRGGSTTDAEPRALKSFEYDGDRLITATRANYIDDPAATSLPAQIGVETSFAYDAAGRLTGRTLKAGFSAAIGYQYDSLGAMKQLTYPVLSNCGTPTCNVGSGRQAIYTNRDGFQDRVQHRKGAAAAQDLIGNIRYHPNGMWQTIERRGTGASALSVDRQEVAPDGASYLPRPTHIWTTGSNQNSVRWDPGEISYDAAGNVKCLGTGDNCADKFFYDGVYRLVQANVAKTTGGKAKWSYAYDRFGNIRTVDRNDDAIGETSLNPNPATNRLGAGIYDVAGNLTQWSDPRRASETLRLTYDAVNMATRAWYTRAGNTLQYGRVYVYDADDERVAVIDYAAPGQTTLVERWTVRGAFKETLAEFVAEAAVGGSGQPTRRWSWSRDYVHALGKPAVEIRPNGAAEDVLDLHWDHLGSVRCVTKGAEACSPTRKYFPFGEELFQQDTDAGKLRFTGHERDDDQTVDPYGDLDYMHARYYSPTAGRFLSVDPVVGRVSRPQSWNRYTYALNQPMSLVDPTGRNPKSAADKTKSDDCVPTEDGCQITVTEHPDITWWRREEKKDELEMILPQAEAAGGINPHGRQVSPVDAPMVMDQKTGVPVQTIPMTPLEQDAYTQGAYFINGFGTGFFGAAVFVDAIAQQIDPDQARKSALVNRSGPAWTGGVVAGSIAANATPAPKASSPKPKGAPWGTWPGKPNYRGRYGDGNKPTYEPIPPRVPLPPAGQ